MRKLIILFLASVMIICTVGCGNASSVQDNPARTASPTVAPKPASISTPKPAETAKPASNNSTTKEKVTCSMCNGTGKVKYHYGDSALEAALAGKNDYEYGPCTSCDGTGYIYITVESSSPNSSNSNVVTCPSCGKKVSSLISKKDAAGVTRNWCSSCWADYNAIMG